MAQDPPRVNELARKRADRADNNELWSPLDAVVDGLARVQAEALPIRHAIVLWVAENEDGAFEIRYSASHVGSLELLGVLEKWKHLLLTKPNSTA